MRNDAYLRRKQLDPLTFMEDPRYVTARINSHFRPVEPKLADTTIDDPETRGVTLPYGQTE